MSEIDLVTDNKKMSTRDLDRLRLAKDERARVVLLDQKLNMLVRHWVTQGPPNESGRASGRYVACKGDYDRFMSEGTDPDNCPACASASPEGVVSMPRRAFAANIARYHTNSQGKVIKPISLAHQVWTFGDDKFNRLVDRSEEHGDLRKIDLIIRCTSETYQNMDIDVGRGAEFMNDESAVNQYKSIVGSRPKALEDLLGSDFDVDRLERFIADATHEESEAVLDDTDDIVDPGEVVILEKSLEVDLESESEPVKQNVGIVDLDTLLDDE